MSAAQTAGDLVRATLSSGEPVRTLARRLAGPRASHTDIERWRAVVVRTERGGEPREEHAKRISDVFGEAVRQPERPLRTSRAELQRRLEEVEDGLNALGPELRRLADRVEELEQRARPRTSRGGQD